MDILSKDYACPVGIVSSLLCGKKDLVIRLATSVDRPDNFKDRQNYLVSGEIRKRSIVIVQFFLSERLPMTLSLVAQSRPLSREVTGR